MCEDCEFNGRFVEECNTLLMAKDKLTLIPSSVVNNGVDTNQKPHVTMISMWKQELHQEKSRLGATIDTKGMLEGGVSTT